MMRPGSSLSGEIPIWGSKKAEEGALLNRQLLVVILLFCAGRDEGEKDM